MANSEYLSRFLYPASIIVPDKPTIIKTVLGSCISVCMFNEEKKVGGINHFMLPFWRGNDLATPKFGNVAMEKLLKMMLNSGANKHSLVAKVFGGAGMLNSTSDHFEIGRKNSEVAKIFLREFGIPIVSSDIGGNSGRKILFNTHSGEVFLKVIKPSDELIALET